MRVDVVTLFPELFDAFLETSFVGRARRAGGAHGHPPRSPRLRARQAPQRGRHAVRRRQRDAHAGRRPRRVHGVARRGRGRGRAGPLAPRAAHAAGACRSMQSGVERLVARPSLMLVCGRYEGFDERVRTFVDEEVSLGDFVLTGGEVAAMAVMEACSGCFLACSETRRRRARSRTAPRPAGCSSTRSTPARRVPRRTPSRRCSCSGNHAAIDELAAGAGGLRANPGATARPVRAHRRRARRRESGEAEHEARSPSRSSTTPCSTPAAPSSRPPSPTSTSTTSPAARGPTACSDYFIVHPITAQRELVARIREHWRDGASGQAHPATGGSPSSSCARATTLADA